MGQASRGICKWSEGRVPQSCFRWEASDQRGSQKAPLPQRVAFCVCGITIAAALSCDVSFSWICNALPKTFPPVRRTCHSWTFPVLSELPIERLTQAIQARVEQARRRVRKSSRFRLTVVRLYAAKSSHRKGHSLRKAEAAPGRVRRSDGAGWRLQCMKRQ